MSLIWILVLLAVVFYLTVWRYRPKAEVVCTRCHTVDSPIRKNRGSFLLEVVLWLCFLLPGLIYSVWRFTTKHDACRHCGSYEVVSTSSTRGISILNSVKSHP